jgi:branched-chain amino acid transport system ATP-binding protein
MPLLSVSHLSVDFGGVRALNDVSFEISRGEIVGIIGPNGAGKTTLVNAICGLVQTTRGEISFAEERITRRSPPRIAALGLGRTFQTSQLFSGMTVLENVMVGLHLGTRANVFTAGLHSKRMREEEEWAAEKAWQALCYVGMERFADRPGTALSFGQQRVVEIARTLISDPKIVLLDEPAVGLSLNRIEELDCLLQRIREERGVTLIMIEHVIRLVMNVCDRVIVLNSGIKLAEGTPDEVVGDERVIEAYLGKEFNAQRLPS